MTVVAIQRIRSGVLTSADQATLSIVNSAGVIILPTTIIAPTSEGMYSYDTSSLDPGQYTATWVFTTASLPTDTISRAFTVDAATELNEGISLMELERLVARRIGPYRRLRVGSGSSLTTISVPRLKSSIDLGEYEDSFLLRRGLTYGDELVTGFVADDRIRQIKTYTSSTGILEVDRTYDLTPVDGEAIEIHALDPDDELRPAVIDGLKRCFFWDTVEISSTDATPKTNLTGSAYWLLNASQIRDVEFSYPSQFLKPRRLPWWDTYRSGKNLWLQHQGMGLGTLRVHALRPVSSLVNGELSLSGPNDDLDILYVDPDYAAWAGVVELWKTVPEQLQPLAAQNMRPSREDAATEFTKKSMTLVAQLPDRISIDFGRTDITQIGNLAEPVI